MAQAKVWKVDDPDLPRELQTVRYVFTGQLPDEPEGIETPPEAPRGKNEGLHNYFMRKGLKCFCPDCRKKEGKNVKEKRNRGNGADTGL